MSKKMISMVVVFAVVFSLFPVSAQAALKEGASSFLLPTTGQAMNGQLGAGKTKLMGAVEVASVITTTVLGITTGGATVLIGAIPLAANHIWSGTDALVSAKRQQQESVVMMGQQDLLDAQRGLELSRDQRFAREQETRYDIRERIRRAGEMAN